MKIFTRTVLLAFLVAGPAMSQQFSPPTENKRDEEEELPGNRVNELFVGEKLYVQEKGEWIVILESAYDKSNDVKEFELATEVRYGITDRIQLSLEVPYVITDPDGGSTHQGIGDLEPAINWNFLQRDDLTLAARVAATIPTGDEDRDLGGGQFAWSPELLAALRLGKGELYGAIGAEFGDDVDRFIYTIAATYPITRISAGGISGTFNGLLELTGLTGGHEDLLYLAPGITFKSDHKPLSEIAIGAPIGLTHDSDDFIIVARVVFEF